MYVYERMYQRETIQFIFNIIRYHIDNLICCILYWNCMGSFMVRMWSIFLWEIWQLEEKFRCQYYLLYSFEKFYLIYVNFIPK